jgi:hypothetical protein
MNYRSLQQTLFALTVLLTLTWIPAEAQPSEKDSTTTSLTVGYLNTDFYPSGEAAPTLFDYSGTMRSLMISGVRGQLALAYGTRAAGIEDDEPSFRMVDVFAMTGGNAYLLRGLAGLPVSAYIPIRINLNYRYLSIDQTEGGSSTDDGMEVSRIADAEAPTAQHLGTAGLGAGLGARVRIPTQFPVIGNNLVVRGSLVIVPGGYADLQQNFETIYMSRTRDLNFEVKLEQLLGGNVGVTLGYTRRTLNRTPMQPESFSEALDTVLGEGELLTVSRQNVIRVGINW